MNSPETTLEPQEQDACLVLAAVDVQSEREAQKLLDDHLSSITSLGLFEDDLETEYYALMRARLPAKAAFFISRTLRKTAFAAMSTLVYTDLLHEITPKIERGEPLAAYPAFPSEYPTFITKETLKGTAATFMHRMAGHLFAASDRSFNIADNDSTSAEHHIWEVLEGAHTHLKYSGGRMRPHARTSWYESMDGNAEVILEVLLHIGHSYSHLCGKFPSKAELLHAVIESLDSFTWGATANSAFTVSTFHTNPLSAELHKYEGRRLASVDALFPGQKPIFGMSSFNPSQMAYKHPSLHEHPWTRERFCPGPPILRPKEQLDRDIVERFFVALEKRFGLPILRLLGEQDKGDGSFDRVTVALLLGALIAEETIFDAWPHNTRKHQRKSMLTNYL